MIRGVVLDCRGRFHARTQAAGYLLPSRRNVRVGHFLNLRATIIPTIVAPTELSRLYL